PGPAISYTIPRVVTPGGPSPRTPRPHVFIAYTHADLEYVQRLARHLEASGIPASFDQQFSGGGPFRTEAAGQGRATAALIAVMSTEAARSPLVAEQVSWARRSGRPVFPLLLSAQVPVHEDDAARAIDATGQTLPPAEFVEQLRRVLAAREHEFALQL